jgi:hypothetical protein
LGADVKPDPIMAETMRNLYDGVPMDEVYKAAILATRTLIEKDPDYTYATARLLMHTIAKEVLGKEVLHADMGQHYANTSHSSSKKAWTTSCSTLPCCSLTCLDWAQPSKPAVI